MTDVCDIVSTSSTYAIPEFSRTEVLRRQNSFCQSKSSPHLHHKTPPFSIFIPPPPPLNPSYPKFQTPQAMADHISTNQRSISSLRHKGQANRCEDENPSNVPTNKEDFYTHVTSKLQELTTPLLGHDDVIFLQCLGTGDFGKLDLCELKKEETEKDNHKDNHQSNKKDNDKDGDDVRLCVRESKDSPEIYSKTTITCNNDVKPQDVHKRWTAEKKKRFLVAVKSLKYEEDEHRRHFLSEMERSSKTRNENIAQLLGVWLRGEEGPALVYEFTKHGDLVQFLRGCVLADQVPQIGPEADTLSHGCLTHLGCQVASGMKYLEKCGLVHGDLSARNCLVGPRRLVKICDLARWRSNYRGDYFPPHPWSPPLPVRWMAWEAIHVNETTSKSDVWSFGVTMWEILSLARLKPYHWLTDEQVISNIFNRKHVTEDVGQSETGSFCNKQTCWQQSQQFVKKQPLSFQIQQLHDFRQTLQDTPSRDNQNFPASPQAVCSSLPQPIGCSKEIYDLLIECWNQDFNSRPSFADIHLFLLRYNDGHPNTPKNCSSRSDDNIIMNEHDV